MPTTRVSLRMIVLFLQSPCRAPAVGHLEFLGIVEILTTKPCLTLVVASLPSHTQSDVYVSLLTFLFFTLALKPKLKSIPDLNIIFSTHYKACNFKRNFFKQS